MSRLRAGVPASQVGQLLRRSREHNAVHGITGLLLYDGECFAQLIEGEAPTVDALMDRIARDPRHEAVRILIDAVCDERLAPTWRAGWAPEDVLGGLRSDDLRQFMGLAEGISCV